MNLSLLVLLCSRILLVQGGILLPTLLWVGSWLPTYLASFFFRQVERRFQSGNWTAKDFVRNWVSPSPRIRNTPLAWLRMYWLCSKFVGAHMNILFVFKVKKILVFIKWLHRSSPIMLTIKSRMVITFWAHSPICFERMSFWWPFLESHLTNYRSNIGVRLR